MASLFARIRASLTTKIVVFVCVTEVVLLAAFGFVYLSGLKRDIDQRLTEKLLVPATLMSRMALGFDIVTDLHALGEIVQERVVDAFVARRTGDVYFASDPAKIGRHYAEFVNASGKDEGGLGHRDAGGLHQLSLVAPITVDGKEIGWLYLAIDAAGVAAREEKALLAYVGASSVVVLLTLLITGFWVNRLLVPRLDRTVAVLEEVQAGRYAARVGAPGAPDRIGVLMRSVDAMIARIDDHTADLQALAEAGGAFAAAESRDDVQRARAAVVGKRFPGVGAGATANEFFLRTLGGLQADAVARVDALTSLRAAEQEYRELFNNAVEGIFKVAPDGRLVTCNPALASILGYGSPAELMEGAPTPAGGLWASLEDEKEFFRRIVADGEVRDFEVLGRRRDGTTIWLSLTGRAVRQDGGGVGCEGFILDISDRKRREASEVERKAAEVAHEEKAELLEALSRKNSQLQATFRELQEAQAKLVRTEKMATMGTMAAGVAHDLNNILSGIVGYPDLLLLDLPAESPLRESIEAMRESGMRAAAVVADLLTLARGAALTLEACDLGRLAEQYLRSPEFLVLAGAHPEVRLETHLAADLRPVQCSRVHMQKVIMNLVMNAFEAIRGRGQVTVSTANVTVSGGDAGGPGPGEYVTLLVEDTGPGIAPADLARIFEPFFTKKVLGRSGTGLGLTVVLNTVQEHGGAVTARSGPAGASFTVFLPAAGRTAAPTSAEPRGMELRGSGRILVVDDERQLRDMAARMLTALGYTVEAVSSGEEAVAWLRERCADLVLLDMLMPPGMNGCETYQEIVRVRPGQKALICSGFSQSADYAAARRLGVGGFLKKPFRLAELGLAVKKELAGGPPPAAS